MSGLFSILKWQNSGLVNSGFTADFTTVIQAADDVEETPSFIVYGWLNNFNTSDEGVEYGMKISVGDNEQHLSVWLVSVPIANSVGIGMDC